MRHNLDKDPAVLRIASECEGLQNVDLTIGKLWRVWVWASENGKKLPNEKDVKVGGATVKLIDVIAGIAGLGEKMKEVGWVRAASGSLVFPNILQWLFESAKDRAKQNRRQHKHRAKKRDSVTQSALQDNATSVANALPQDRTVHDSKKEKNTDTGDLNPDRPGNPLHVAKTGTGAGAIESRMEDRAGSGRMPGRSKPAQRERQVNEIISLLGRVQGNGLMFIQHFCMGLANACHLSGADYNHQQAAIKAVATRIAEYEHRESLGAEIIMLAVEKLSAKGLGNPWSVWQSAVNKLLRERGLDVAPAAAVGG
jgi:hypothetical protein